MVILGQGSLTLVDVDGDSGLLVLVGSENLRFFGWDDSSSWDDFGHNSSNGLDTESKWGHIDQKDIFGSFRLLASKNTTLNSGTVGNGLVWVDSPVWFFSIEKVLDELLNLWNSSGSTNEDNLVNFTLFHA
jgi:hypothetical protein